MTRTAPALAARGAPGHPGGQLRAGGIPLLRSRDKDAGDTDMEDQMTTHGAIRIDRRAQAGFTFVELLVAMIVLGLLAAAMIPSVLGQREKAEGASAQALLRTAAAGVEAAAIDGDGYTGLTTARLAATEPDVSWLATAGARTPENEVSVTNLSPQGYTLTTTSASGRSYAVAKDLSGAPTLTRSCSSGCSW